MATSATITPAPRERLYLRTPVSEVVLAPFTTRQPRIIRPEIVEVGKAQLDLLAALHRLRGATTALGMKDETVDDADAAAYRLSDTICAHLERMA